MNAGSMQAESDAAVSRTAIGQVMYDFIAELSPICRSITGNGVRETLARIGERIPLQITEVPSGTQALDWTVPDEWNIRDAYVLNDKGEKVVDFKLCPLHVLGYSIPVSGQFTLDELKPHLFTDPSRPEWIPFRYSYYTHNWGFCLPHRDFEALENGTYEVFIDSSLEKGSLTYGECSLPGMVDEEVLISVHICHPWMCNDNLSGIAVSTELAKDLLSKPHRLSYRFLFIPTTIGSITWLSRNRESVNRVKHGLVLTCVGDRGRFHYKRTRLGNSDIDKALTYALARSGEPFSLIDFSPFGFDERQYSSPGFNLAVGCFMRTPNGKYPEYHSSADNLTLIDPGKLSESLRICADAFAVLDGNERYLNTCPHGEPQLTKRGIHARIGDCYPEPSSQAMLWVLNLSDGEHTLLDIVGRSGLSFEDIRHSADLLLQHKLLRPFP